ncbi:ABC transporter ATP-binding protein [Herbinix luporum]|uniref:ABC transporter ATP-binding protein n=1 Tax=Herbinix luporum TaxID=1679721 RepID=UPI0017640C8C|nr:ABC transporter ATP-binding protein [Herbinix luporum]MDI9489273.1 ABC transporter ATP-binding protein [Bacillota bacterium]HHT57739.1 ABC transporter ATP-binding protein [Herbinix luporum]
MSEIIRFNNVVKKFDDKTVLDDISFSIDQGDIFGYLGPNGAGKTTTIRMMLGILQPNEGNIVMCNMNSNSAKLRKKIGFCLDDEGLYPDLTANENMEFYDRIYNSAKDRKKRISNLLEMFQIEEYGDKLVSEFSKGMKRRLGLAKALINKPEILILDEPTNGLDPDGQFLIKKIFRSIAKETTIFFSSHNLSDVEDICTKVAIIKRKLLYCDKISNISSATQEVIIISSKDSDYINIYKEFIANYKIKNYEIVDNKLNITITTDQKDEMIRNILNQGLNIDSVYQIKNKIENLYFDLLKGESK